MLGVRSPARNSRQNVIHLQYRSSSALKIMMTATPSDQMEMGSAKQDMKSRNKIVWIVSKCYFILRNKNALIWCSHDWGDATAVITVTVSALVCFRWTGHHSQDIHLITLSTAFLSLLAINDKKTWHTSLWKWTWLYDPMGIHIQT